MKLLVLSALLAVALSKSVKNTEDGLAQWEIYKIEHEKVYETTEEEEKRRNIFLDNLKFVKEHNAKYDSGEVSFNVEINKFADMTSKEFGQLMNGLRVPPGYQRTGEKFVSGYDLELPKTVDWRKKGAVTPVKNQGDCGSCWAFSATGSLEGQTYIKKSNLPSLSEQNLVDCSKKQGNLGCHGGLMDFAFAYIKDNNGIDTESSYPYEDKEGKCRYNKTNKGAVDTGFVDIPKGDEKSLQKAVATVGPISVGIDASLPSFQMYKSGIYNEPDCSSTKLDHGVLGVGYGTAKKGGDYWLVKNSWGTDWGMKGYIMMARNRKNMCGIATVASYPTV